MENEYISDLDGVWTPSYFTHVSITTSIAPALKNYCNYIQSLLELVLEAPTDFFYDKPLLDPDGGFRSERPLNGQKFNGCIFNGHPPTDASAYSGVTAM